MSKIEELIEQLCPEGVEFRVLGEIGKVCMCKRVMKHETTTAGDIPFFKIGTFGKEPDAYISRELYDSHRKKYSFPKKGEILISASGTIGRTVIYNGEPAYFQDSNIVWINNNESKVTNKFLFYFYKIVEWKTDGGTIARLYNDNLSKTIIPNPPLPIQQKIVNILDKFTQLQAELEAELQARRAQYEYYRNQLLNFEGKEVEWKTLGEIGQFIRGKRFVKNDIVAEGVPCIHYGEMYTHYKIWAKESKSFLEPTLAAKLRVAHPGDVIIVAAGETVEDIGQGVAWLGESNVVIHDACFAFAHNLDPKYVSYFLQTDLFHSQIKRYISSGKISSINAAGLSKASIPIPSMQVQQEIVRILDKFNTLINDKSVGLPAEIQARRKQYEYYRGKLLDFKRINN